MEPRAVARTRDGARPRGDLRPRWDHVLNAPVSRHRARVALDPQVPAAVEAARRVLEQMVDRDEAIYGATTGVAALKRVRVPAAQIAQFNAGLTRSHRIAQGPAAAGDVVRAMMLRLLNHLASGYPGVRAKLLSPLVDASNR